MPRPLPAMLTTLATLALTSCASSPAQELRVLVKLVHPSDDARAIAERAGRSSGKPARYLAAAGGQWHALALGCASTSECDAALLRLRRDSANFEAVQRDERKRAASP